MAKQKIHSEYFRIVSLGKRKSCPHCGQKLPPGESIWSWGEYIHGTWGTVQYFCQQCFSPVVECPKCLTNTGDIKNGLAACQRRACGHNWYVHIPDIGVKQRLQAHSDPCGCIFELVGYGGEKLPAWLTLDGVQRVEKE